MKRRTRRIWALLCLLGITLAAPGCISFTSWAHNKRHLKQFWNQMQGLHEDIDRIVFGLERNPAE
ncbi:MAG: hypothetical protein KatS3mg102_0850 [Planctomycetota bacterium]|nr:MAG: hypothetical protein KatS3mg102_0850 [Planctomycetota bacterium]